ncbi:UNVERIFIED_CONTAM: hypothetical protein FKN15_043905 [Acipenser sinensis]
MRAETSRRMQLNSGTQQSSPSMRAETSRRMQLNSGTQQSSPSMRAETSRRMQLNSGTQQRVREQRPAGTYSHHHATVNPTGQTPSIFRVDKKQGCVFQDRQPTTFCSGLLGVKAMLALGL